MHGADILDQRDPLGKSFAGSVLIHGTLIALIVTAPYWAPKATMLGDKNAHSGAIGVDIIKTIPLPKPEGPANRVANDSKAIAPEEPQPKIAPKPVVKEKIPENAIPIPTTQKQKPKRPEREKTVSSYHPEKDFQPNQVYSETAPRLSSDQFAKRGTGGIDEGPSNPFGDQFGWYADQVKQRIAQKWNRAGVSAAPRAVVVVEFIFVSDGSIQNQSVKILKSSGSYTLDTSAQRAILDANLPPFPKGFNFSSVKYDLSFGLEQ
jgi:outer membrane biosynthesis protein TonB